MAREPVKAEDEEVAPAEVVETDEGGPDPDEGIEDADDQSGDGDDAELEEAADAAGDDEGQAGAADQVKPKGRASDTIRQLRDRAQRAEREREEERQARVRAEAAAAERGRRESDEQERARISLMTPEERADYRVSRLEQEFDRKLSGLAFQSADQNDKSAFKAMASVNQVYAKHEREVETRLAELRKQGQNVSREVMLKFIIGEKAVERAATSGGRQRAKATERVNRETTRPGATRSDTASVRGKETNTAAARRQRLEDVPI